MSTTNLEAIIDFLGKFIRAEADGWAIQLRDDVDRKTLVTARRSTGAYLDPTIDFSLRSLFIESPERPRRPDSAWFEKARLIEVHPRTLYAVQGATIGSEPVALAWLSGFKPRQKELRRYVVADIDGEPKITTYQVRCLECQNQIWVNKADQIGCGECGRQGWRHAAGTKIKKPKPTGDVRKLVRPPGDSNADQLYWDDLDPA